jgi:hypothetical protein
MNYTLSINRRIFFGESDVSGEYPPRGDAAIFQFFELFALAFAFEGISKGLDGQYVIALISCTIAAFLYVVGQQWRQMAVKISETWQPVAQQRFLVAFLVIGLVVAAWFGIFRSSPLKITG